MDIVLPAAIGGVVGGITVLIGATFLLRSHLRRGGADSLGLSLERTKNYKDISLKAHEIRSGGMWVQLENIGTLDASFANLQLSLFDGDRLVAQHDLMTPAVPAARSMEFVIPIVDDQHQPVEVGDHRYELSLEMAEANV